MKNTIKLLGGALVAAVILFTSCGGAETPKAVSEKFMNAIEDKKYDEAAQYATDDTKAVIELIKGGKGNETKREFVWGEEKIDGDKATVKYKVKGSEKDEEVSLIKKDDKWLVSMTKSQMTGKTGLEGLGGGEEAAPATEGTEAAPATEEAAPAETK
ncbi:unnamed protein product [Rotaria sordida]|uniref:DUF4878 domain-containing protein n=1 Tax=Rotaria sordida TaxID=392033 RepID=A0A813MQR2_9BILA|nr:unnamed protein product [Rotaria sordida]